MQVSADAMGRASKVQLSKYPTDVLQGSRYRLLIAKAATKPHNAASEELYLVPVPKPSNNL